MERDYFDPKDVFDAVKVIDDFELSEIKNPFPSKILNGLLDEAPNILVNDDLTLIAGYTKLAKLLAEGKTTYEVSVAVHHFQEAHETWLLLLLTKQWKKQIKEYEQNQNKIL